VEGKQFTLYAEDHNKIINLVAIENGKDEKVLRVEKKEARK
jgi:hypothetical protein